MLVPFLQLNVNGPPPEAVVLKLTLVPGHFVWSVNGVAEVPASTISVDWHGLVVNPIESLTVTEYVPAALTAMHTVVREVLLTRVRPGPVNVYVNGGVPP